MLDILIKHGTIIDGKKTRMYRGDVGVKGERISAMGDLSRKNAKRVIDASNHFVAPGFVDITNHSDTHWTIFSHPAEESMLRQGVTTIFGGSCGSSLAPLAKKEAIGSIQKWADVSQINVNWQKTGELLEELQRHKLGVNFGTLVGHGTLRRSVLGDTPKPATAHQRAQMNLLLEQSLSEGAFGLSFGLTFSHGRPASDEELVSLAKTAAAKNRPVTIHLRDEGKNLLPAITEALRIARESGASLEISHFKALGRQSQEDFEKALGLIRKAREEDVLVTVDFFPYTRTGSLLYTLLPAWARDGGKAAILARISDKNQRNMVREGLEQETLHYDAITIASAKNDKAFVGRTLKEAADEMNILPEEALLILLEVNELAVTIFGDTIREQNLITLMQENFSLFATDGVGLPREAAKAGDLEHPRSFGAAPEFLGTYVREKNVISWEDAIYKMTRAPTVKLRLPDRGVLEEGAYADIAIFHPETIRSTATYQNPFRYPEGIPWVLVNGSVAIEDGELANGERGYILQQNE